MSQSGKWFVAFQCDACGVMSIGSLAIGEVDDRIIDGRRPGQRVQAMTDADSSVITWYPERMIGKGLKEDAHEIRYIGNEMAHGDFVTADIDEGECADVPATRAKFRQQRTARKQQGHGDHLTNASQTHTNRKLP